MVRDDDGAGGSQGRLATARLLGALVTAGALVVMLVGWGLGLQPVTQVLPGLESMKFNTALGLACLGLAPQGVGRTGRWRLLVPAVAGVALALGLATSLEYVAGVDLGIDELLVTDPVRTGFPGRMGLNTAIAFSLLAAGWLLAAPAPHGRAAGSRHVVGQLLGGAAGVLAMFALLGYLFGVSSARGIGSATQMALHTSVMLLLASAAMAAATAHRGPLAVLWSPRGGGRLARAMLLPGFAAVVLAGAVAEAVDAAGLLDGPELQLVLAATITGMALAAVTLVAAARVELVSVAEERARADARTAQEALARANEELERRVAERTAELAATVTELQRSSADLDRFAFAASHDLREPLRMISAYASRLHDTYDEVLDERGRTYLRFAVEGVARMTHTIDGVLEFSQAGNEPLMPTLVTIRPMVTSLLQALGAQDVVVDWALEEQVVLADPVLLRAATRAVLDNALKFVTPDVTPHLVVRSRRVEDFVAMEVVDNGIGIPPAERRRVTEMFRRLNRREEYPGSGIGLAVARRVVERHGGMVEIEGAPSGGSIVRILLPRRVHDGDDANG